MKRVTRRDALQALTLAPVAIPGNLLAQMHEMKSAATTNRAAATSTPKCFTAHQYATLRSLCDSIIPADESSGGALEAGAPELIDLLASENSDYKTRLGGGLVWLDSACHDRFGHDYLDCSLEQKGELLQKIAYRESAHQAPELSSGIAFFAFLRDLTLGAYFTSETGMKYLPYLGNKFVQVFPGCPTIPDT